MQIKRILIGSEEICGVIGQFTAHYRSKGYKVVNIAAKTSFFTHTYDIDPNDFMRGWKAHSKKSGLRKSLVSLLYAMVPVRIKNAIEWRVKRSFLKEFDLYINIWKCFLDEEIAFKAAKEGNVKWMTICMGDDFRNRWAFQHNFDVNDELLPGVKKDLPHLISRMSRIRAHEKNANIIFSGPDQSSLSLRPYFHAHVPVDLSEATFRIPENKKLKLVHCPSDANAKGTKIIETVIKELQEEGMDIEFLSLRKVPHRELMNVLSESDILVDELVFHGPGYLSIEAMASGCAVLTKYYENSPASFRPPVVSVTKDNLKEKLRDILNDRKRIVELANEGRKYVEKNNSLELIADYYLDCLMNRTDFDYYPDYFRNEFDPVVFSIEPKTVNDITELVTNEAWYKEHVKTGERTGLKF
ncbi:MAG: hypothetical protein K0S33_3526 [Bacteroidetes bacterium]|jgi:hypothetical protein|nr:hypothetical protein [Bacteroidota bacterium]